jgi:hypothetical protein
MVSLLPQVFVAPVSEPSLDALSWISRLSSWQPVVVRSQVPSMSPGPGPEGLVPLSEPLLLLVNS